MNKKKFNDDSNEFSGFVKLLVLIFEMGLILLACTACLLILISTLPVIIKTAAFGLFAFVIRMLVKHFTTVVILER